MHNGDGHHVLADGQRPGESVLSEPGYPGHGDYDGNRLGLRLAGKPAETEDGADPVVVAVDPGKEPDQRGHGEHHHPCSLAELRDEEYHRGHRGSDGAEAVDERLLPPMPRPGPPPVHNQATLRQGEAGENEMAKSGMSASVFPRAATSSAADNIPSAQMPGATTCRSSRMAKKCGRQFFLASKLASTGRPPNEVLAASASTTVMLSDTR